MSLQSYELELLSTSLPIASPSSQPQQDLDPVTLSVLGHLRSSNYKAALAESLCALAPLSSNDAEIESTSDWFDALSSAVRRQLGQATNDGAAPAQRLLLAAVSSLYIFTQANLTGPALPEDHLPECPFDLLHPEDGNGSSASPVTASTNGGDGNEASAGFGRDSMSPGDRWAAAQLSEDGEDLLGRTQYPQYLLISTTILNSHSPIATLPPSWHWWCSRAVLMQQRLLSSRSATLRAELLTSTQHMIEAVQQPGSVNPQLSAVALIEAGIMEISYGHIQEARQYVEQSNAVLGLSVKLTGALGVRTIHQQEAKAQLIVDVQRSTPTSTTITTTEEWQGEDSQLLDAALTGQETHVPSELKGLQDESDVLLQPKLVAAPQDVNIDTDDTPGQVDTSPQREMALNLDLSPLEQAVVMAQCLLLTKGSAADEIKPREAAAYAEAVMRQQHGSFMIRAAAVLQASRAERSRPRTRERALLRLEGLDQGLELEGGVPAAARMRAAFTVHFPLSVSLRRELGESLVALGLVGAALPLFESLELWDNLIVCYQLLDKKVQAEQLVRRRLEAVPDDPRLLCALGDLLQDDKCYQQAWEVSRGRNARSQRSLARNANSREEYSKAAEHWEAALALNPLHPEGWFSLGYCRIKDKDYPKAMHAYTRSVQMDPENGEAWNNLAAVHMNLEHWQEAFNALMEAVKHKRDSWHTWDNYADVAAKVHAWQAAVRGLGQVLKLSDGKVVNLKVLDMIVRHIEGGGCGDGEASDDGEGSLAGDIGDDGEAAELAATLSMLSMEKTNSTITSNNSGQNQQQHEEQEAAVQQAKERAHLQLINSVGTLMKQIASTESGGSAFWGQYARFYTATGQVDAAKECLLKRVRALQGAGWQQDQSAFEQFASASLDLCKSYLEGGKEKELGSARMHLRGVLKQALERYEEHALYAEMKAVMERVELELKAVKEAT